ncbi:MAG: HAD-IIIA family hydrolase [Bacteroidota bacterium]
MKNETQTFRLRAKSIKLLLTDCDGVLTDAGVYYSAAGEELKRFSIRDGMGVERLRKLAEVEVGILTGENSPAVAQRAAKLKIKELHLGCHNKLNTLHGIVSRKGISQNEVAFIGDDVNDLEILQAVGLSACPADALDLVSEIVNFQCKEKGGHGAFREFAELIIRCKEQAVEELGTSPENE